MNDSEQYHTGRAAAYDSAAHLTKALVDRVRRERRVASPDELVQLQMQFESLSLGAEAEAEKRRVEALDEG